MTRSSGANGQSAALVDQIAGSLDPEMTRTGDDFRFWWPQQGRVLFFQNVREEHGRLECQASFQCTDTIQGIINGHLHWADLNMGASSTRKSMASYVQSLDDTFNWHRALENAVMLAQANFRHGTPAIDLSTVKQTPTGYLIDKMVPNRETTTFYGDGSSAKSLSAQSISLAARLGITVGPFKANRQTGVLYLDWETTEEEQAQRLRLLCKGLGIANVPQVMYRRQYRALSDDINIVRNTCRDNDIGLVIVDSIAPACGGEPEKADVMLRFFNALRSLENQTRIVVSHISKADRDKRYGDSPFGSVFVYNMSRSVWKVKRGGSTDDEGRVIDVGFYHTKSNSGPRQKPLAMRYAFEYDQNDETTVIKPTTIDLMKDAELIKSAPLADQIRDTLKLGGMTAAELAKEIDASESAVKSALSRMRDVVRLVGDPSPPKGGRGRTTTWGLKAI